MRHILTTLLLAISLGVTAQDVKIQGPKKQQNTVVKKTTSSGNNASSNRRQETTETVRVYYDANTSSIVYGNNHYNLVFVASGIYEICQDGGEFCSADSQPYKVALSSYNIGQTEVTQGLWKAVMGKNPSVFKGDNLPVENVSWEDCQEFISKLNILTGKSFSLPTEAEWEFAARGGNLCRVYTKYSGSKYPDDIAWYESNSNNKTHPVATKQPNNLGIHDMSGNVSEWCQDWYGAFQNIPTTNPRGAATGTKRVRRGGSFRYVYNINFRLSSEPSMRSNETGLRLCIHSEVDKNLGNQAYSKKDCNIDIYERPDDPYGLVPKTEVIPAIKCNVFENGKWQGWIDTYLQIVSDPVHKTLEINIDEPILLYITEVGKETVDADGTKNRTFTTRTTDGTNGQVLVYNKKFSDGSRTITFVFSDRLAYCFGYNGTK